MLILIQRNLLEVQWKPSVWPIRILFPDWYNFLAHLLLPFDDLRHLPVSEIKMLTK